MKTRKFLWFLIILSIFLISTQKLRGQELEIVTSTTEVTIESKEEIREEEIQEEVTLLPELKKICSCESGDGKGKINHFDKNGNVLRGKVNNQDIGACQISLRWHGRDSKKMGLDIFKEKDNYKYANWLYKKQGAKPWSASKNCHKQG